MISLKFLKENLYRSLEMNDFRSKIIMCSKGRSNSIRSTKIVPSRLKGVELHTNQQLTIFVFPYARWKNTSQDILTCVKCSEAICVTFGKTTQKPQIIDKLSSHYRQQLVFAHKTTCPFLYEAQGYLLDDDKKDNSIVPDYLLSLMPSLLLFENAARPEIQIRLVYENVLSNVIKLEKSLSSLTPNCKFENNTPNLQIIIPEFLKNYLQEQLLKEGKAISGDGTSLICSNLMKWAKEEGETLLSNPSADSLWISMLGWETSGASDQTHVKCPCCFAETTIPIFSNENQSTTKRQRLSLESSSETQASITNKSTKAMNIITSHRLFCPYLGGALAEDRIGWQIIVNQLIRWQQP